MPDFLKLNLPPAFFCLMICPVVNNKGFVNPQEASIVTFQGKCIYILFWDK